MLNTVVKLKPMAKPAKRTTKRRSLLADVRLAFEPKNRTAAIFGCSWAGAIPFAAWWLTHREIDWAGNLWTQPEIAVVGGALAYSAKTVYESGLKVFAGDRIKAASFVVLSEGVMMLSDTLWLSSYFLAILMFANAVAAAVALIQADSTHQQLDQ